MKTREGEAAEEQRRPVAVWCQFPSPPSCVGRGGRSPCQPLICEHGFCADPWSLAPLWAQGLRTREPSHLESCLPPVPSQWPHEGQGQGHPSFPSSRVPSSSPPEFCFSDALLSVTGKAASEVAGSPTVSEKRSHPKASRTLSPLLSQPQWACHQRAIQFSERSFSHVFP